MSRRGAPDERKAYRRDASSCHSCGSVPRISPGGPIISTVGLPCFTPTLIRSSIVPIDCSSESFTHSFTMAIKKMNDKGLFVHPLTIPGSRRLSLTENMAESS